MKLSDVRVGSRMGLGFGVLLLLMLAMGLYAAGRVSKVQSNVVQLGDHWLPSSQRLAAIDESLNQMRRSELQMLLGGSSESVDEEYARLVKQWEVLPPLMKSYGADIEGQAEREQFKAFSAIVDAYRASQDQLVRLARGGQQQEALAYLRGESRQVFRSTSDAIARLTELNTAGAQAAEVDSADSYRSVLWGIWLMVALAVALGAVVAWLMTKSLTHPLREAAAAADRIAGGDLSGEVASSRGDELGDLLRCLARM